MAKKYVKKADRIAAQSPQEPSKEAPPAIPPSQAPARVSGGSGDAWQVLREKVHILYATGMPRRWPSEQQALAAAMAGEELGLPPVAALGALYLSKDERGDEHLVLQPMAMAALVASKGIGTVQPREQATPDRAVVVATRFGVGGRPDRVQEFVFDRPKSRPRGGDDRVDRGWCQARAISEACGALFQDVISAVPYVPEDFSSGTAIITPAAKPVGAAAAPRPTPSSPPPSSAAVPPVAPSREVVPEVVASAVAAPDARPGLTHTIWLADGKGGVAATKTAGVTREQIDAIIARTTQAGGHEDWSEAAAECRPWMTLRGLPEPKLRYLTKDEADELLAALSALGSNGQAGSSPAQGEGAEGVTTPAVSNAAPSRAEPTAYERLAAVLELPAIAPNRALAIRGMCAMYKVKSLEELDEGRTRQVASDLVNMSQDVQAFAIILERLASMA